jgi:hypothetical protein
MYSKNQTIKRIIFWLLACTVVVGFFIGNPYPSQPKQAWQVPTQSKTNADPFLIQAKGQSYYVKPLYNYQMQGVVVSKSQPRQKLMADIDKDIKAVDLCIVWGDNLKDNVYQKLKYRSGDFSCFYSADSMALWQQFNAEDLSNSHIITDNPVLLKKLRSIKVGDQVVVSGYLAEYGFDEKQIIRGTSITRTDTGNGACETIFIQSLKVIPRPMTWVTILQIICGMVMLMLIFIKRKEPIVVDDLEEES